MDFTQFLIYLTVFALGAALGIFLSRFIVKRELAKNPPISEDMIAAMLKGMGQPATPKRVKQIVKQMKEAGQKK